MGKDRLSGWEIPPVQPPPKTYNEGLEAAALYHDEQAIICEALGRNYTIESAKYKDDALTSRKHAAAIRALKNE